MVNRSSINRESVELPATNSVDSELRRLRGQVEELTTFVTQQQDQINQLVGKPRQFGTLIANQRNPNPDVFHYNDEVIVVDRESPYRASIGRVISGPGGMSAVNEEGQIEVEIDGSGEFFYIGNNEHPPQIRLTNGKDDGTFAVVVIDGKSWQVHCTDLEIQVGDRVIVNEKLNIIGKFEDDTSGIVGSVLSVNVSSIEVDIKGEKRILLNPKNIVFEVGDRVLVDKDQLIAKAKQPEPKRTKYKLSADLNVGWDDIGGQEEAKIACREALENPYIYPEHYVFYKIDKPQGILFFGPPGNGKTMLAKACATSIAKAKGATAVDSGFIYVKCPEILSKWVGESEREVRNLFNMGRKHYKEHGYPAVLALDELDAIAPQRGIRRSSDVSDTIVPMFLGEMDGVDSEQTKANPIVIAMTNRADILDPAVTRDGRFNNRIRISRPDRETAMFILKLYLTKTPLVCDNVDQMIALSVADIYSKTRVLYRINNEHDFTYGDVMSGATLAALVNNAKMVAMRRDIANNTFTGIGLLDLREAIEDSFKHQMGLNHAFDIEDFGERNGLQLKDMQIQRSFSS